MGNALGSGQPRQAKIAALSSLVVGPALFSVEAVLLTEPHCQRLLLQAFAGSTVTPALARRLTSLLRLLALMQIFDCLQYSMQGVVQVDSIPSAPLTPLTVALLAVLER